MGVNLLWMMVQDVATLADILPILERRKREKGLFRMCLARIKATTTLA